MQEFDEMQLPELESPDTLVPVLRLAPGDRISLKDAPVLERCECGPCTRARGLAADGKIFRVIEVTPVPRELVGSTHDMAVIDTHEWGGLVPITMRFKVLEFAEDSM